MNARKEFWFEAGFCQRSRGNKNTVGSRQSWRKMSSLISAWASATLSSSVKHNFPHLNLHTKKSLQEWNKHWDIHPPFERQTLYFRMGSQQHWRMQASPVPEFTATIAHYLTLNAAEHLLMTMQDEKRVQLWVLYSADIARWLQGYICKAQRNSALS